MVDRPIIFSGPMVRALLEGRKTMTRRLAWHTGKRQAFDDDPWTDARESIWQKVQPGDRLWVRESMTRHKRGESICYEYAATPGGLVSLMDGGGEPYGSQMLSRSIPSIHMPRAASRLTLSVTAARIERVQDITTADIMAEGIHHTEPEPTILRYHWQALWESLHGPGAWAANPEVVALTFTVANVNIDTA